MFTLKGLAIAGACALLAGTTTMAAVARPAHVASVAPDFVADVVGPYLAIQTALVNDELGPIAAAAKALRTAADSLGADGKVNSRGMPSPLQLMVLTRHFSREVEPPPPLRWVAIPASYVLAPIGRLLGVRPRYERYSGPMSKS